MAYHVAIYIKVFRLYGLRNDSIIIFLRHDKTMVRINLILYQTMI